MKQTRACTDTDAKRVRVALSALLVDREKILLTRQRAAPYRRSQVEAETAALLANVDVDIRLLLDCLEGEYGASPDPADVRIRDKADLELSTLVSRRFHLALLIDRNRPSSRPTLPADEIVMVSKEIAAISAKRSSANVRLYRAKRVKSVIAFIAAREEAERPAA